MGAADCCFKGLDGHAGQVPDGGDTQAPKARPGRRPDTPQGVDLHGMQKASSSPGGTTTTPRPGVMPAGSAVGLAASEASLATKLRSGHPDRRREADVVAYSLADLLRDVLAGAEQPPGPGHIEKSLVEGDAFDERRVRLEDFVDSLAVPGVPVVAARHEDRVRAQPPGLGRWHCGPNAVDTGLVAGRGDHASPARPADHEGLPRQRRVLEHLDRRVERVHVDVEDGRIVFAVCHRVADYAFSTVIESGGVTHESVP